MSKYVTIAIILLGALLVPLALTPYMLTVAILVLISMGLATSLNLIVGYAGQISFAHAAFYGIGAYTSAIVSLQFGLSFWLSLLCATIFTGLMGFLIGLPCLRLKGHYLAIATIGFQEIIMIIMLQWNSVTRGPAGLIDIERPSLFGIHFNDVGVYYLGIILVGLILLFTVGILRSKLGLQMIALREDETASLSSGINTTKIKLTAFALSSAMAGALGSFYAHYIGNIDPFVFNITLSATILVMLLAGGIGTIVGPLLGAIIFQIMPELLRAFNDYRMAVYGLVLILIILFMPAGVVGLIKDKFSKKKKDSKIVLQLEGGEKVDT